jgi:hypothetical protein
MLRRTVADMDSICLVEVEDAGHGWTEAYVRRQLDLILAFLSDEPLPVAASSARVA